MIHLRFRDLKPENILLEQHKDFNHIKLIDFGAAITFKPQEEYTERIGTCYYIAPEVVDSKYTEKCDIWSCGVITFIALSGEPPFNGHTD